MCSERALPPTTLPKTLGEFLKRCLEAVIQILGHQLNKQRQILLVSLFKLCQGWDNPYVNQFKPIYHLNKQRQIILDDQFPSDDNVSPWLSWQQFKLWEGDVLAEIQFQRKTVEMRPHPDNVDPAHDTDIPEQEKQHRIKCVFLCCFLGK